jgi:hypothetical protein
MKTETARRGAPVTARRRIPMGIRVTPELRNQLLASAEASGRSITSEMELRLENSFRSERYLDEALDLAFGRQATGLLKAIARVMVDVGPHAAMAKNGSFESAANWLSDPFAFDQAAAGISALLAGIRPQGDSASPAGDHAQMGEMMAVAVLIALKDRECGGELGDWARPVRAGLGEIVDRITVDPNARIMINASPPQQVRSGQTVKGRLIDAHIGRSIGRVSDDIEVRAGFEVQPGLGGKTKRTPS